MHSLMLFRTYFFWSLEFPFIPEARGLTILLIVNFFLSLIFSWRKLRNCWKRAHWVILANLVFFPIVVAVGVTFAAHPSPGTAAKVSPFAEWTLDAILLLSVLIGIFCVYAMRGLRWLALSAFLVEECLLFGAMFISGMAISGDWL
jgi:hypothetical protein